MCTRLCLCNSCYKRNTCSDCNYINEQDQNLNNRTWSVICATTGVQECKHYMKPLMSIHYE